MADVLHGESSTQNAQRKTILGKEIRARAFHHTPRWVGNDCNNAFLIPVKSIQGGGSRANSRVWERGQGKRSPPIRRSGLKERACEDDSCGVFTPVPEDEECAKFGGSGGKICLY
jgi:hypothetical protein